MSGGRGWSSTFFFLGWWFVFRSLGSAMGGDSVIADGSEEREEEEDGNLS